MNAPIEDQLRDYFTMVDRMQGPIDPSTQSQDTPTLSLVTENIHDTNESTMEVIMISPDRNEPSNRSRTWMLVAASVAAIALVGGLIVVANRDSDEAPANQPTVTVADTASDDGETAPAPDTDALTQKVATIEAMTTAYSEGRFEDYSSHLAANALVYGEPSEGNRATLALMAADNQWTIEGPCRAAETDDAVIACPYLQQDSFHGSGGLAARGEQRFVFGSDGLITSYAPLSTDGLNDYRVFGEQFATWLRETHPDVAENYPRIFLYANGPLSRTPKVESMPLALEYVDEFVAEAWSGIDG